MTRTGQGVGPANRLPWPAVQVILPPWPGRRGFGRCRLAFQWPGDGHAMQMVRTAGDGRLQPGTGEIGECH